LAQSLRRKTCNAHPAHFMWRAYRECGEFAEFDLGGAKQT
jgi:hypothetical protein